MWYLHIHFNFFVSNNKFTSDFMTMYQITLYRVMAIKSIIMEHYNHYTNLPNIK